MFKDYKEDKQIKGIKKQHNIMAFIGNGFDIAVLNKYRDDNLVSSYSKFYDYLCYKGFPAENVLYRQMAEDKRNGKENWSDFECSLGTLLGQGVPTGELDHALEEIQGAFLLFLNEVVTPEVLLRLNDEVVENRWGKKALARFLGDLKQEDYEKMAFPERTEHYDMYNYLFVNFNYTSLFDNYIYLDKKQFEPRPHRTVDTNFSFLPNPNGFAKENINDRTVWSSFLMVDTIHPHGYQNIPRSLLFGVENNAYLPNSEYHKFNKSYWAQSNQRYKSYFYDAELFIIYGTSIGETDSWWWENVFKALLYKDSELIIYFYNDAGLDEEQVKYRFIEACKVDATDAAIAAVMEKIYVVLYDGDSHLRMFALKNENEE